MRKVICIILAAVLVLGMATVVLANNGNGPNNRPNGNTITFDADNGTEITIRIEHRNSAGQFFIIYINDAVVEEVMTQFGTFTTTLYVEGYTLTVRVQGNSLVSASAVALEPPKGPPSGGCDDDDDDDNDNDDVFNSYTWTGSVDVQGGNNGIIVVTVNGTEFEIRGSFGQSAVTRTFNVEGFTIAVTSNDNNMVTRVVATSTIPNVPVVINNVVSLTPGNQGGNEQ